VDGDGDLGRTPIVRTRVLPVADHLHVAPDRRRHTGFEHSVERAAQTIGRNYAGTTMSQVVQMESIDLGHLA